MNFFKKISLFLVYRKKILSANKILQLNYNCRIDNIFRIYTVLNIPSELIEEPYNLRKADIDTIAKAYIKDYSSSLSDYLNTIGLTELFEFYSMEKVDKYSYLLIFGFSLFNTKRLANTLLFIWLPLFIATLLTTILFIIF